MWTYDPSTKESNNDPYHRSLYQYIFATLMSCPATPRVVKIDNDFRSSSSISVRPPAEKKEERKRCRLHFMLCSSSQFMGSLPCSEVDHNP